MEKVKTVLYLGQNNFPVGLAATQRQLQISKAIKNGGNNVLVINRKGTHSPAKIKQEGIKTSGSFEGIDYVYASGTPLYPSNFIARNLLKIVGFFGELLIILYYRFTKNATCAIVSSSKLSLLKYYWYLSRILKIKIIFDYVEYSSSLADRSIKVADGKKSFDTVFIHYADAFIIISSYLEQHVKKLSSKPYLIIPPIIDFDKYARIDYKPGVSAYFLYCSTTYYLDVIEFIIESYRKSQSIAHGVWLVMVINGNPQKISELKKSIENDKTIKIISDLPYDHLIGYYKNAQALLIPLQNNLQDKARFPFKISEYTAAARPIITSDSGAVIDYFTDGENALLAKTGDPYAFTEKLNSILTDPRKSEEIATRGHQLGQSRFNYKSYTALLTDFLFLKNN